MPWARATSDGRAPAVSWRTHWALKATVCFRREAGERNEGEEAIGQESQDNRLSVMARPPHSISLNGVAKSALEPSVLRVDLRIVKLL